MPMSIFNKFEFSENEWVVSLFNSNPTIKGKFSGHSVLLIEGQTNISHDSFFKIQNCIYQCDIFATPIEEKLKELSESADNHAEDNDSFSIKCMREKLEEFHLKNVEGVITNVRIFETYYENKEKYQGLSARSWKISSEQGKKMLNSIRKDQCKTKQARKNGDYIPYQSAGNRVFFSKNDAHNCTTWCLEKLEVADIQIPIAPLDYVKTPPEKHVKENAEKIELKCVIL